MLLWTKQQIFNLIMALFKAVGAFTPDSAYFLDIETLASLAMLYQSNMEDFNMDGEQTRRITKHKSADKTMPSINDFVSSYWDDFFRWPITFQLRRFKQDVHLAAEADKITLRNNSTWWYANTAVLAMHAARAMSIQQTM